MKEAISTLLCAWYRDHARALPWRTTRDSYRIWLSEVILQQTRVEQGEGYYLRFVERFPTVSDLAAATEDEVLKLWQGLGYYSRARNLHAAAQEVVRSHGGCFPSDYASIRALRGVGDYTAAAVASLAYDLPYAVVDGNVYRVLARLFAIETPIDSTEGRRLFAKLAEELLPAENSATHNQAMMEFGALCCTPQHPHCTTCPLADRCLARATQQIERLPVKEGRTRVRDRYFYYLHLTDGHSTLLHRRSSGDIWAGLYQFPLIETEQPTPLEELIQTAQFQSLLGNNQYTLRRTTPMKPHLLSHQRIHATFMEVEVKRMPNIEGYITTPNDELDNYAISRLTERYLLQR